MQPFDELVGEAVGVPIAGWEFAWLDGRAVGNEPAWSYPDMARSLLRSARSLLDLDTGGGELLADLAPWPWRAGPRTCRSPATAWRRSAYRWSPSCRAASASSTSC